MTLTARAFAVMPDPLDGTRQELVRGVVVSSPIRGFVHGLIRGNTGFLLGQWAKQHGTGRVTFGTGIVTEVDPDTVRGPDVAFWSFARLPADQSPRPYPDVPADLVAEVVSPGNTRRQIATKVREYFAAGVRLVWVVDPDDRSVTGYTQPGNGLVLWSDATLTGGDVLPTCSCPVATLFEAIPA